MTQTAARVFRTPEEAELLAVTTTTGESRYLHHYYGSSAERSPGPQGFLVDMPEHNTGRAHFHGVDQFQVFFGSEGAIYQSGPLEGVVAHYSDGFAAYGPFSTGDNPISFFTLRAHGDVLTAYLPEDREKHVRFPGRRNVHAHAEVADLPPAGVCETVELFTGKQDNMAAYGLRLGPGATGTPPAAAGSEGQYLVVAAGSLVEGETECPARSLGWVDPDAPAPGLTAGADGAYVLVLQFPAPGTPLTGVS